MIAGAVAALSMVPICFTSTQQPDPPKAQPLALVEQFRTAPAAVIACFGAGFVNGAVLQLAPLYANFRFGETAAANFYAAAIAGSLLIQWPAGRLSDRIDRRLIIASLSALAALAAIPLALIGANLHQWSANLLFLVWGAGALSFYGVAVAHMADRAEPGKIAQSAAGLLFVWAGGSVLGPLVLGFIADAFGATGVFAFAAIGGAAVCAAMFWRQTARRAAAPEHKEDFAPYTESSVAAAELAHGQNGAEQRRP
jgi:MFS family permease